MRVVALRDRAAIEQVVRDLDSQLAGNAVSRVVPAGAAAGVTLQYRMLAASGVDAAAAGSALTASTLLQLATLAALPALGVLFTLGGQPIADSLRATAWVGLVAFVLLVGGSALLAVSDRAVRLVGRFVQWLRNFVLRMRPPLTGLPSVCASNATRSGARSARIGGSRRSRPSATARSTTSRSWPASPPSGASPIPDWCCSRTPRPPCWRSIPLTPGGLGFVEAGLAATLVARRRVGCRRGARHPGVPARVVLAPTPVGLAAVLAFGFGQRRSRDRLTPSTRLASPW